VSTAPKDPLPVLADFPDWQSPMVVKELRHGLRTRFFSVALIQFHILLILMMGSVLVGADEDVVHGIFWTLALVLVLGVMPVRGFSALTGEVTGGTLDMLTLTNLSSWRIVYGKWAALFSQTLLVVSSLLPYMVARYYLGGVEIVAEAAALALAVLASSVATAAIVAFSTQKPVLLRLLLLAGVIVPLIPFSTVLVFALTENSDLMDDFSMLDTGHQAAIAGGMVLMAVYGTYLFITLGASRFASRAENHSTVKRLVGLAVMTVLGVTGTLLGLSGSADHEMWCLAYAVPIALILGMDVMTEAMPTVPMAIQGKIAGGWWRHLCGRLLYPGWASGVMYYALICLAPLAIGATETFETGQKEFFAIFACLMTANAVPTVLPILREKPFLRWWVVQLALVAMGSLVMILAEVSGTRELAWVGIITPGTAMMAAEAVPYVEQQEAWITGSVFGGLWMFAALIMAAGQMRQYRVLEREAAALARTESPNAANA
jgi:ABC-type transport system involved in multi-copper enzyme maturation permease subunit